MTKQVLIIGANGGIAQALAQQSAKLNHSLYTVSREPLLYDCASKHYVLDAGNENEVAAFFEKIKTDKIRFDSVICTTGVLHTSGSKTLKPEKRLEDINFEQLAEYFRVNTAIPAIWLKHLAKYMNKTSASIVFFSARVGSISENVLGGWYGYRASKAALNMIVKTAAVEYKRRSPNTVLACYHPGTVDTQLSKPFQANVASGKLFTADFTASKLLQYINEFELEQSPYYIDWEGKSINY